MDRFAKNDVEVDAAQFAPPVTPCSNWSSRPFLRRACQRYAPLRDRQDWWLVRDRGCGARCLL